MRQGAKPNRRAGRLSRCDRLVAGVAVRDRPDRLRYHDAMGVNDVDEQQTFHARSALAGLVVQVLHPRAQMRMAENLSIHASILVNRAQEFAGEAACGVSIHRPFCNHDAAELFAQRDRTVPTAADAVRVARSSLSATTALDITSNFT